MAFSSLPNNGVCSYGEFVFGPDTETTGVSITPQYDSAGRTVTHVLYGLDLRTHITGATSGSTSDANVAAALRILTTQGLPLVYTGRGMGDFKINTGPRKDVIWGPKPRVRAKPIGGDRVCEIDWHVDVCTLLCADAMWKGLLEYNFSLAFDLDYAGYTTRRYSGHLKIAATRSLASPAAFRALQDVADKYREQIVPPVPKKFRRESQSYTVSAGKDRLDFNVVDVQLPPNVPPNGIIKCEASHTYSTGTGLDQITRWVGTLSATYELAVGTPASNAVVAFQALLLDRLDQVKTMFTGEGVGKGVPPVKSAVKPLPHQITVSEPKIYDRTEVRLSCSYRLIGVGLAAILRAGGLWRDTGNVWATWAKFSGDAMGPRGHAKLVLATNDDKIVDLCGFTTPTYPAVGTGPDPAPTKTSVSTAAAVADLVKAAFPPPSAADSWMSYTCNTHVSVDTGRVVVKTLPAAPLVAKYEQPAWDAMGSPPSGPGVGGSIFPPAGTYNQSSQVVDTVVQQRTTPTLHIRLTGSALRAGFGIPCPELVSVNGVRPTLVNGAGEGGFRQGVVGNVGVPLIGAAWDLHYVLESIPPGSLAVPPNDFLA